MSKFRVGNIVVCEKVNGKCVIEEVLPSWFDTMPQYIICDENGRRYNVSENYLSSASSFQSPHNKNSIIISTENGAVFAEGLGDKVAIALSENANREEYFKAAREALDKLLESVSKPYNDKLVCVSSDNDLFVVGKVYFIEDGFLKVGDKKINKVAFNRLADVKTIKGAEFIPLVE